MWKARPAEFRAAKDGAPGPIGRAGDLAFVLRYPLLITRLDMFLVCALGTIAEGAGKCPCESSHLASVTAAGTGDELLLPGFSSSLPIDHETGW